MSNCLKLDSSNDQFVQALVKDVEKLSKIVLHEADTWQVMISQTFNSNYF